MVSMLLKTKKICLGVALDQTKFNWPISAASREFTQFQSNFQLEFYHFNCILHIEMKSLLGYLWKSYHKHIIVEYHKFCKKDPVDSYIFALSTF